MLMTMAEQKIPQQLMTNSLLHFQNGVPICDLDLQRKHKDRLMRVEHAYWQWVKNPMLDAFELLKQLIRNGEKRYADPQSEWRAAQKDKWLFDFIVDNIAPPSRRVSEAQVRHAGRRLMQMGLETDNGKDIAAGAKIIMQVDRLDQPESERADISKAMFIPPVVTTAASEMDPTKEDQTDEQARLIMSKYNAYVDDKRKSVDDKVEAMLARRGAEEATALPQHTEQQEEHYGTNRQ